MVMAYRVEYPTYKVQIENDRIVGFRGSADGYGINISFVQPDHSTYFANERTGHQLKGLRLVTFEIDEYLWKVIDWKASQKGDKKKLKSKWLEPVLKLKKPTWSDGSNLTKFIKQTALGFNDDWLDLLAKGVVNKASVMYYEDILDGLKDDDLVYAYLNDDEGDGVVIRLGEVETQGWDDYMTVAKAIRLGYHEE